MKQLIITLGILCLCLNSKLTASNYFTQSNTPNTTIEHQLDAVDQLLFNSYAEQELKLTPQQIQKLSTQQRITILGRFFRWIGEFFEPVWGKYREPHRRTQGPYMVFQYTDISDLQAKISIIRNNITTKKYGYDKLYYEIFITARDGATANCNDKEKVCENANTAKCAAFVYIIGLDLVKNSSKVYLDTNDYFTTFSNSTTRDSYRTKAENILLNVNVPELNNLFDRVAGVPFLSLSTNFINGVGFLDLIHRSRELLSYLAAFDMLRWCHNLDPSLPESSGTSTTDNMAKRLKKQIATPIYNRAIGLMFPVNHNNHSLMVGAALGSAAIVIGEWGGKSLFDWHNWPNRWANVSNYQIHNVMWRDPLIYWPFLQFPPGKLSATGGTHGFAEGDHYFKITMENMLPYMVAQYNYQQGVYTRGYRNYPIALLNIIPSPHALYMKTMMKDPDYDNLFKWYRNITMPNGKSACIDESWNNVNSTGILGIKK